MLKKLWTFVALLTSAGALLVTNAYAYPGTLSGWGASTWNSIIVWSDWEGLANYERKPTEIKLTIVLDNVALHYLNPGGNAGGWGVPFDPHVALTDSEVVDVQLVNSNGEYTSEFVFHDNVMFYAIPQESIPPPVNPNWTIDESNIRVNSFIAILEGWSDDPTDEVNAPTYRTFMMTGYCVLDPTTLEYSCGEDFRATWKLPRGKK